MNLEEAKHFIMELASELKDQQNHTARPIQYHLQVREPVMGKDLPRPSRTIWACPDRGYYDGYETEKNLRDAMLGDGFTKDQLVDESLEEWDVYDTYPTAQTFLTQKGLEEHIRHNAHNLGKRDEDYRIYIKHGFRNFEQQRLEAAIELLAELFNKERQG